MGDERRGKWLPLVYYYLATIVGLTLLLFGLIGGLGGLVTAALPETSEEFAYTEPPYDDEGNPVEETPQEEARREAEVIEQARIIGIADALRGLITTVVALPVFLWHLRQARRKEPAWVGSSPA